MKKLQHLDYTIHNTHSIIGEVSEPRTIAKVKRYFNDKGLFMNQSNLTHPSKAECVSFLDNKEDYHKFSKISSNDKWSFGYYECIGIIICGNDIKSGKPISRLSHQYSGITEMKGNRFLFKKELSYTLNEIRNKVNEKSLQATIFGGRYLGSPEHQQRVKESYIKHIQNIGNTITRILDIQPKVIAPHFCYNAQDIYFDNNNMHLHVIKEPLSSYAILEDTIFEIKNLLEICHIWDGYIFNSINKKERENFIKIIEKIKKYDIRNSNE